MENDLPKTDTTGAPAGSIEGTSGNLPPASQAQSQSPASSDTTPAMGTVTPPPKKGSGFRIFVIVAIVVIIIIYGVVAYLYFQNTNLAESQNTGAPDTSGISPTPEFTPDQIQLENGNIVRIRPSGEVTTLIDKNDYNATGITGFARVVVSPDNSKMCFESWPPAPEPALYYSQIDGTGVAEVSPNRQNCLWSEGSQRLFYLNRAIGDQSINIYEFSLQTSEEENLTAATIPEGEVRNYEIVGLSADSSKIICRYEPAGLTEFEEPVECEIILATGEVNFLE